MGRAILPCVLMLAACSPAPATRGGIVSLNPCADALLVRLAPERIAAISHYSHEAGASSLPLDVARRYPATGGTAEEVIARHPDLVVTDIFAPAASLAAYRRAGLRVVTLGSTNSIADSEAQVLHLARAVGAPNRGQAIVAAIDRATAPTPFVRRPAALFFIAGDLATGGGTLLDALMTRAGFRNAAADYGLRFTGTLPVESIARNPPAVVIATGEGRGAALRRRVLARTGAGVREARFPRDLVNCGGPGIVPAMARLRAIRQALEQ